MSLCMHVWDFRARRAQSAPPGAPLRPQGPHVLSALRDEYSDILGILAMMVVIVLDTIPSGHHVKPPQPHSIRYKRAGLPSSPEVDKGKPTDDAIVTRPSESCTTVGSERGTGAGCHWTMPPKQKAVRFVPGEHKHNGATSPPGTRVQRYSPSCEAWRFQDGTRVDSGLIIVPSPIPAVALSQPFPVPQYESGDTHVTAQEGRPFPCPTMSQPG